MDDEPPLIRHFLLCRHATFDSSDAVNPYSLHHVVFALRVPEGVEFPYVAAELWLFVQIEASGVHELWVDLTRRTGAGLSEDVASYGPFLTRFGPDQVSMSRAWRMNGIPFPIPGWYDFTITAGGEPLAAETILVEAP